MAVDCAIVIAVDPHSSKWRRASVSWLFAPSNGTVVGSAGVFDRVVWGGVYAATSGESRDGQGTGR